MSFITSVVSSESNPIKDFFQKIINIGGKKFITPIPVSGGKKKL